MRLFVSPLARKKGGKCIVFLYNTIPPHQKQSFSTDWQTQTDFPPKNGQK